MYAPAVSSSSHGNERTPMTAVIMPPILNEMYLGARFEKSKEGETTFAAMFVEIWAIAITNIARIRSAGMSPVSRVMSTTGSQIASPQTTTGGAGTARPRKPRGGDAQWRVGRRGRTGEPRGEHDRVPDSPAEDDHGRRRHRDPDKGEGRHGEREPYGLPDDLGALALGAARTVRDVEEIGR